MIDYSDRLKYLYTTVTVQGYTFDLDDVQVWGSLTAGIISITNNTKDYLELTCSYPTGGTPPYTYQWFRGDTHDFLADSDTLIVGRNNLTLTTNIPSGYYLLRVMDSAYAIADTSTIMVAAQPVSQTECEATSQYFCDISTFSSCTKKILVRDAYVPAITVCNSQGRINFDLLK